MGFGKNDAYDSLLMPRNFWSGSSQRPGVWERVVRRSEGAPSWSVARPPAQDQMILYYEMMNIWTWLFLPALICAIGSIVMFLVALTFEHTGAATHTGLMHGLYVAWFLFLAIAALCVPFLFFHHFKPHIGVND